MISETYIKLGRELKKLVEANSLQQERIEVKARTLTPGEAIGNPERDDFPLLTGRERLMQAEFRGSFGQAYTDMYGDYTGTLEDVMYMEPDNNYRRGIFIATLNAVMRSLGLIEGTVHCRDRGPKECGMDLVRFISEEYGNGKPKVLFIGLQPALAAECSGKFDIKVLDLDPANIGNERFGTVILNGGDPEKVDKAVQWCDVVLATGSTIVNDTLPGVVELAERYGKPLYFYGNTIAGAAKLLDLKRFCPRST